MKQATTEDSAPTHLPHTIGKDRERQSKWKAAEMRWLLMFLAQHLKRRCENLQILNNSLVASFLIYFFDFLLLYNRLIIDTLVLLKVNHFETALMSDSHCFPLSNTSSLSLRKEGMKEKQNCDKFIFVVVLLWMQRELTKLAEYMKYINIVQNTSWTAFFYMHILTTSESEITFIVQENSK